MTENSGILSGWIRGLSTAMAVAGLGILMVLATSTMMDGLLRFLISRPIDLVREIGDLIAAFAVACCLPMALLSRSNITLRALDGRLPRPVLRLVDLVADLLTFVVLIAIAWQFFAFARKTAQAGDVTWMMNLPKAPFWYAVDACLWLSVLVQLAIILARLRGEDPQPMGEVAS